MRKYFQHSYLFNFVMRLDRTQVRTSTHKKKVLNIIRIKRQNLFRYLFSKKNLTCYSIIDIAIFNVYKKNNLMLQNQRKKIRNVNRNENLFLLLSLWFFRKIFFWLDSRLLPIQLIFCIHLNLLGEKKISFRMLQLIVYGNKQIDLDSMVI